VIEKSYSKRWAVRTEDIVAETDEPNVMVITFWDGAEEEDGF